MELDQKFGVYRFGNEIVRVKSVFKSVGKAVPTSFCKPDKATYRRNRHEGGKRLFTPEEIRTLLNGKGTKHGKGSKRGAGVQLKAMVLLGINCGLGNSDCANLPTTALDLATGWLDFPRPKTGIGRRCPLWPETVAA